jgi:hypothetical protein
VETSHSKLADFETFDFCATNCQSANRNHAKHHRANSERAGGYRTDRLSANRKRANGNWAQFSRCFLGFL